MAEFRTETVFACEGALEECVQAREVAGWCVRQIVWEPHQPHEPCRIIVVFEKRD